MKGEAHTTLSPALVQSKGGPEQRGNAARCNQVGFIADPGCKRGSRRLVLSIAPIGLLLT
jgi:hypothetical protein